MESWEGAQLNQAKEILASRADQISSRGRGKHQKAREASHALFCLGGGDSAHANGRVILC